MIEINIPFANNKVFYSEAVTADYSRRVMTDAVKKWLKQHCPGGWGEGEFGSWKDAVGQPIETYYQSAGITFQFLDETEAMLFKLTFA